MRFLLGLSSNSNLPGGNSRPGDIPPGLNRVKRKITNIISNVTPRKRSTIITTNTPKPKRRNGGKSVTRRKIRRR